MQRFEVTGMSCAACSAHVEKAVAAVPGVAGVSVSLLTNSMQVEYEADPVPEDVIAAVEGAGYGAAVAEEADADALEDTETPKLKRRLLSSSAAGKACAAFPRAWTPWWPWAPERRWSTACLPSS